MQRFESQAEYENFVETIYEQWVEMARPPEGGAEDEWMWSSARSVAAKCIAVPQMVGDDATVLFNGLPYVSDRADPTSVYLYSRQTDYPDNPDLVGAIHDNDVVEAAIVALSMDLEDRRAEDRPDW